MTDAAFKREQRQQPERLIELEIQRRGLVMDGGYKTRGTVMNIHVTCPNGHKLKVNRKLAGKSGRCPSCKIIVKIPELSKQDTEEEQIMDILASRGSMPVTSDLSAAEFPAMGQGELPVHQEARHQQSEETREFSADESNSGGSGSSLMRRATRRCSGCGHRVSANYNVCPHCKRYMTETPEAGDRESVNCPSCGVPSFPGADVCMNCGLQLLLRD